MQNNQPDMPIFPNPHDEVTVQDVLDLGLDTVDQWIALYDMLRARGFHGMANVVNKAFEDWQRFGNTPPEK